MSEARIALIRQLQFIATERETYTLDEAGVRKAIRRLEDIGKVCGQAAAMLSESET